MNKNIEVMEKLNHLGFDTTPKGAGHHVRKFLERNNISVNQAGSTMGVSPPTVRRLIGGGSLSESMAAKLAAHYSLSISMLFNLEASYHTHNAKDLLGKT